MLVRKWESWQEEPLSRSLMCENTFNDGGMETGASGLREPGGLLGGQQRGHLAEGTMGPSHGIVIQGLARRGIGTVF